MSCHRLAVARLDLHRSWLLLRLDRHGRTGSLSRSAIIGNRLAGRNTARLVRLPPERPVRRPPSYRCLTLPLLALASMIAGTAAAQSARPARPVRQYTIEQFMNTTAMFGASFSPDERSILVTSDQSGVFNAYEIPAGGGKPQARTRSTTDGIFTVGYLPHDRRALYLQGPGGNENDHLFLLDTIGTARDLTPGDRGDRFRCRRSPGDRAREIGRAHV